MFRNVVLLTLFIGFSSSYAQEKKGISHEDYDLWKRIEKSQISKDGHTIVATISTTTGRGDGYVKIFNSRSGESFTFKNGHQTQISSDGTYVFFLRKPSYELVRKEKKDEVKPEERTKQDFFIFDIKNHRLHDSILRVKKFEIPEETAGWVVLEKHKDLRPTKDSIADIPSGENDSLRSENLALKADYALVYDLQRKRADTLFQIKNYELPKEGDTFIFSTTKGGKEGGDLGVFSYDVRTNSREVIDTSRYSYTNLAIDRSGEQLAFSSAKDSTEQDSLKYELFYVKQGQQVQLTDTLGKNLRKNWEFSHAQSPYFSEKGKRLFFYSRPIHQFNTDTTLLKEEIPEVDVWSYHDDLIQPEQKARHEALEEKAYQSFYDTKTREVVTLHDPELEFVLFDDDREQRFILGYTSTPYAVERSWEYPWVKDFYIIDTRSGEKSLALKGISSNPILSPDGDFAVYYDIKDHAWWILDLQQNTRRSLTKDIPVNFFDEENDVPARPRAYGFGGFTKNGNPLFFDQFDIWNVPVTQGKEPVNITRHGRENNIQYRSLRLDRDQRSLATYYNKNLLVTAFDKVDKTKSLYTVDPGNGKLRPVVQTEEMLLGGIQKAEKENTLLFRKENFQTFPDLFLLEEPSSEAIKLTHVNPQQKEFKWGTVEQFSWTAYDGTPLDGLLYKPDDFNENKKYPLMVYFYEKNSDNLHRYHSPQPSASIVNMSYLVSNDYLVFVPDIVYQEGKPGGSAYNAIVSGVEELEKEPFVDSQNMAIQGQSWGGYQVAHLVTVTNKFKAAMAGAPVSNMTSAYGGIRWQTGLSRAFQYEKTQSRIGKNLWEGLDLYIENSPLFGIPEIETPLLMMHNDEDGAVPYYQGIEMFMGMRRLNKPVWLLVYNNEAHNLRKVKNKQDLSIRMMQFFDHYLKGEPAPEWMTKGLPAIMKGKDLRYDLEREQ